MSKTSLALPMLPNDVSPEIRKAFDTIRVWATNVDKNYVAYDELKGFINEGSSAAALRNSNTTTTRSPAKADYDNAKLKADLAAGVDSIIAASGGDYRLDVDTANARVLIYQKDVAYKQTKPPGTRATGQVAIGLTSAGIAMGYNDATTGIWTDAVAVSASGNATFLGNVTATGGTFVGGVLVGSGGAFYTGKTSATDTTSGFWLGTDGAGNYDFHIGNATNSLWWDGSAGTLTVKGNIASGSTLNNLAISNYLNNNITLGANGILSGAGGGQVTLAGIDSASYDYLGNIAVDRVKAGYISSQWGITTGGSVVIGTAGWNGTSGTGTGLVLNQNGIAGVSSGTPKFYIKTDGSAGFAGELVAASGTFAGNLTAAVCYTNGLWAEGYVYARGNYQGASLTINYGTFTGAIWGEGGYNPNNCGVIGYDSGVSGYRLGVLGYQDIAPLGIGVGARGKWIGVYGETTSASGWGGYFRASGSGSAIKVEGKMEITDNNMVANLFANWSYYTQRLTSPNWTSVTIYPTDSQAWTGGATPTLGANKPGSNSTCAWLTVNITGSIYYIPIWT